MEKYEIEEPSRATGADGRTRTADLTENHALCLTELHPLCPDASGLITSNQDQSSRINFFIYLTI